jgi:hypothetical protein
LLDGTRLQTVVLAAAFAPEILCAIWIKTAEPHFAVRFNDECSNKKKSSNVPRKQQNVVRWY